MAHGAFASIQKTRNFPNEVDESCIRKAFNGCHINGTCQDKKFILDRDLVLYDTDSITFAMFLLNSFGGVRVCIV